METHKWKIIEEFVLSDPRFDADDFEEYLEVIGKGVEQSDYLFLSEIRDNPLSEEMWEVLENLSFEFRFSDINIYTTEQLSVIVKAIKEQLEKEEEEEK